MFQAADDHTPQQSFDLNLSWFLMEAQSIFKFSQNWLGCNIVLTRFYADLPPPEIRLLNAVWII
jgi:hypothetical protein